MKRGNCENVFKSEVVKLVKFKRWLAGSVRLVNRQHNRLPGFLQHGANLAVGGGQSVAHVRHENYNIRHVDCKLCLQPHLLGDDFL